MNQSDKIRLILLEELSAAQARNPAYSMRLFSKRIGVSQTAISEILAEKRPATRKTIEKILKGLDRNPKEISRIYQTETKDNYTSIDMDAYHLISEWHHYAILSLAETDDFESSPEWIAKRLNISTKKASDAIDLLLRLDMLKHNTKTNELSPTKEQFQAISEIANPAMKKAAREDLELAQKALESTEFSERDHTAMTLCFDPERMQEAIKMIKNFRRLFSKTMESKNKNEVYRLNVQLFPLTNTVTKGTLTKGRNPK